MTDTATVVAAAPFVAIVQPYLMAIATAVVPLLITIAVQAFTKWTGVKVDAAYTSMIEAAAATEAGKAIAAASDNLATAKVDVGSRVVAIAVQKIMDAQHLKAALAATGASPQRVASIVVGEIGKLQAQMAIAPIPVAAPQGAAPVPPTTGA